MQGVGDGAQPRVALPPQRTVTWTAEGLGPHGPHACSLRPWAPRPPVLTCRRADTDVRTTVCFLFIGHYLDTACPES